eukprot:TRINITY_DN31448_c0_g1_i2.p1 TRINITY_DN31448_c0_g1~~TRINITY_DN31448_c0_g1_i2.p1  ORF type:complete len:515 (+),score=157.72 TRINITY_DN31448_c0_g1_i2:164-1708(+)
MKFLTGDDTGLIKLIRVEAQKVERFGSRKKGDPVHRLCWAGPPSNREAAVAVAYESGDLELRDGVTGLVLSSAKTEPGVKCLQVASTGILAISSDGTATVVTNWGKETQSEGAQQGLEAEVKEYKLRGPIAHASVDPRRPSRFVFGGLENDVKIYDLEKEEVTWNAKNVREDYLCLRVPVKVSVLGWATEMCDKRSLILCGTTDGKIRVYDADSQRRPLFELQIGFGVGAGTGGYTGTMDDTKRPLNCGKVAKVRGDSWGFICGDTMGVLREYDLKNLHKTQPAQIPPGRKSHLKLACKELPFRRGYKNIMGSIRDVDVHCSGDALVAVGLGRFAYVFATKKKEMTSKVYLKQKLCCCLMSTEKREIPKDEQEDSEEEDITGDEALDEGYLEGGEEEDDFDGDEVVEGFSDDDEEGEEPAKQEKSVNGKNKKKRKAPAGELEEDAPAPAKAKGKKKRKTAAEELRVEPEDDAEEEKAAPKKKGKKKKTAVEEPEPEEPKVQEKIKKKKKGAKKA